MSWRIADIARLLSEDPDTPANPEAIEVRAQAQRVGGQDPSSTTEVRKQMQKQRELQRKQQQDQQKQLDPFFRDLEDAEGDLKGLQQSLQQSQDQEREALGQMGRRVPTIDKAIRGIKGNLPR